MCFSSGQCQSWHHRFLGKATLALTIAVMAALNSGCIGSGVGMAVNVIGGVIDSADVKEKEKDLLGKPPSAADEMFGERLDTMRQQGGSRVWAIYDVKGLTNPLGKDSYVVEVTGGTIHSLSRVETTPDAKIDLPRVALIEEKVTGKPPAQCQQELEQAPIVTVRSERTGQLRQLYDGRIIKVFKKPYYCILKYDQNDLCDDVDFQQVGASTRDDPYGEE